MVDTIKCDHCGAEARHVVTKEFDGKLMNFCCRGCLGVYEMMREEGLLQAEAEERPGKTARTSGAGEHEEPKIRE